MRVVADFLIVIGVMLLTGVLGVMAVAVGHVSPHEFPFGLLVIVLVAGMLGAAMLTAGVLVHLRKWQKD